MLRRTHADVQILFGTESEFAITALDRDDRVLPTAALAGHMLRRAAARPHLLGAESGVFLRNGARLYIDAGHHPEYATPETTNPWDAVCHSLAGDRLISQLAREVASEDARIQSVVVRKGNIDYANGSTWGSHENYLHSRAPAELRAALVPHLVSRIVFTGSGGFDPWKKTRAQFVLSPRASFVKIAVGTSSPGEFALVDDRIQPHCSGYHRQHLICADANQSHLSTLLRIGTTALVVFMIDAGLAEPEAVLLANPMTALTIVAADVTLRRQLDLAHGGRCTALQIQRHYLRQAQLHLERLPDWAAAFCAMWQDTLDRLERGPDTVVDRLDWAIKLAIFQDRARRKGVLWPATGHSETDELGRTEDRAWRAELCELDLRLGQVDESSLFVALDDAGALRHRVVTPAQIARALDVPPPVGRARIRGRVVARLSHRGGGSTCTWDSIYDATTPTRLDLSDPFEVAERWAPVNESADVLLSRLTHLLTVSSTPAIRRSIRCLAKRLAAPREKAPPKRSADHAVQLNNCGFAMRNTGRLDEAEWLMRAALKIDRSERHDQHPKVLHRRNNLGIVLLLQGRRAQARELVTAAWPRAGGQHDLTTARVLTTRMLIAMLDGAPFGLYVGQLKTHLTMWPLPDLANVDSHWQMTFVLERVAHTLRPNHLELLAAIVDVLNGDRPVAALTSFTTFRDALAQPLDTLWPAPRLVARGNITSDTSPGGEKVGPNAASCEHPQ